MKTNKIQFGKEERIEYQPQSPKVESPRSSFSPDSPLSPSSQELEKRLEEAKQNTQRNVEESKKELQSVIDRLGLEIGDKNKKPKNSFAIGSATHGRLSGDLKDPSANPLFQKRRGSR